MAGRGFEILPDTVELEVVDLEERAGSPDSISSQCGDSCSAVDLSHPNSNQGFSNDNFEKSKLLKPLEIIKQGPAFTNSFTPQSFTASLEAFMGNPHLMGALAEPRARREIADIPPTSIKGLPPEPRSSDELGTRGELVQVIAKYSVGNKERNSDDNVELLNCTFCDYSCTLKCTLNVHMLKHDTSKQFTCSECAYTTSRSSDLKKHLRIHTGEKPFKCELCDYKSTEQGALRKHMLTHNCDNPHCCPHCDYVSPRIGDLKRHMHVHSDKKPHACQHCDYKASQLPRLRKHMLIHMGLKPYHCTYCDYKCREPRNLKTHIQTHTGERPYGCPHCQYKAGRLSSLRRHVTSVHREEGSSAAALPRHFLE